MTSDGDHALIEAWGRSSLTHPEFPEEETGPAGHVNLIRASLLGQFLCSVDPLPAVTHIPDMLLMLHQPNHRQ